MDRRGFLTSAGVGVAGSIGLAGVAAPAAHATRPSRATGAPVRPEPVPDGATVALVAPAGPVSAAQATQTEANMAELGFATRYGPNARQQYGYLAGTDEQRLADLHWAFEDDEIQAVWCIKGGYGSGRLLGQIDYDLIQANPKPFVGFSDVTALHQAFLQEAGLVTFMGPVAAFPATDASLAAAKGKLLGAGVDELRVFDPATVTDDAYKPVVIVPGTAQGQLVGGNATMLRTLIGTPWAPRYRGRIVLLEDVGEVPYRFDRQLTHLLDATDIAEAAGIAIGVFADSTPPSDSLTLAETLEDRLGDLGIPVQYGLPFGHIAEQATIAHGQPGVLDTTSQTLTVLDGEQRRRGAGPGSTTVVVPPSTITEVPGWALQ
ncbi:MAG: S66 peptidase family protein [Phycicoccus sp.]